MLPEISLDTIGFEEIVKKARSQIAEIYPQWTDYNYHDPGITILELFAFLKEAQQFYIDQTNDSMRKKFLQLIGVVPMNRHAAQTTVKLLSEQPITIPAGTKFTINGLCFENSALEHIPGDILQDAIVKPKYGDTFCFHFDHTEKHGNMVLYPFGKNTENGNQFLLALKEPLEKEKNYRLSIALDDHYSVERNPVNNPSDFVPLSHIHMSYFNGTKDVEISVEDGTLGFIRSGEITFSISNDMAYTSEEGIGGYFLKFTLKRDEFDVSPAIIEISFQDIPLVQKDTKAIFLEMEQAEVWKKENILTDYYAWNQENGCYIETNPETAVRAALYEQDFYGLRILAKGNGLPNQYYEIKQRGLLADSFEILVGSMRDEGYFRQWIKVADFDASGPDDCHYIVDEKNNCILFGDGIRGRMPESEIRIVSCSFSAGNDGNIKAGQKIDISTDLSTIEAEHIQDAWGGRGPEEMEEAFARARRILHNDERAISAVDYEKLVMETPGLRIWDCKVLDPSGFHDATYGNEVRIVVRPFSENGYAPLSDAYQKNIYQRLMRQRLIGTSIKLYSPVYIEAEVYTELRIKPQYLHAEKSVENAVRQFFSKLNGFGPTISYSALFACIDGLEEVLEIYMLYVDARGGRISRNKNGDVMLPPLGVLLLKKVDCIVIR